MGTIVFGLNLGDLKFIFSHAIFKFQTRNYGCQIMGKLTSLLTLLVYPWMWILDMFHTCVNKYLFGIHHYT